MLESVRCHFFRNRHWICWTKGAWFRTRIRCLSFASGPFLQPENTFSCGCWWTSPGLAFCWGRSPGTADVCLSLINRGSLCFSKTILKAPPLPDVRGLRCCCFWWQQRDFSRWKGCCCHFCPPWGCLLWCILWGSIIVRSDTMKKWRPYERQSPW